MDILVFGGTFNPPHRGHIEALRAAMETFRPARTLVIPAALPPHKQMPEGTPAPEVRLELCRLAFAALPGAELSEIELRRIGPSYTVDTLEQLHRETPEARLLLLVGGDMLQALPNWREPERIFALAEIVVSVRSAEDAEQFSAVSAELFARFGAKIHRLEKELVEISSTELRAAVKAGTAAPYLALPVLNYIEKNGLYGAERYDFDAFRRYDMDNLSEKRCRHVFGCEASAVALAAQLGVSENDARAAALLHDITKELDLAAQLNLCEKYDIMLDDFERTAPKLLHAKTGAALARALFGVPQRVCDAIYWHTTGKADMTPLEQVLFMADYIEPNRDFPGVEALRAEVSRDFERAMVMGLELTRQEVAERGGTFHHNSLEALAFLYDRLGEKGAT